MIIIINSFVVPVVQCIFDITDWKISELKKIDTKACKLFIEHAQDVTS